MSERVAWGLPSASTSTCVRGPPPVRRSEPPRLTLPVTATSALLHPITRTEPAGFSISTRPSLAAGLRWSTCAARAPPAMAVTARTATVIVLHMTAKPPLGPAELQHVLQDLDLPLMRRGQQMVETGVRRIGGQRPPHLLQRGVDRPQVLVDGRERLGRQAVALLLERGHELGRGPRVLPLRGGDWILAPQRGRHDGRPGGRPHTAAGPVQGGGQGEDDAGGRGEAGGPSGPRPGPPPPRPRIVHPLGDPRPHVAGRLPFGRQRGGMGEERAERALLRPALRAGRDVQLHLLEGRLVERAVHVVVHPVPDVVARHRVSASRSSFRARWSWAFDVPVATPVSSAISSCLYPSTSCSTNTACAPGGSVARARSRSKPAAGPSERAGGPGRSKAVRSSVVTIRATRRRRDRRSDKATFTVSGWSQEEKALSPRNDPSFCQARTKTSWASSSARSAVPAIRKQSAYTRPMLSR